MIPLFDVVVASPIRDASLTPRAAAPPTPDVELQRGFEDEVAPLMSTLHRVARQWTKNADDAEDLVQDTMVRAYSGFPAMRSRTHMKAWFIRIMRNIWIDDYRRGQRRPTECLTGDVGDWEWDIQCRNALQGRDAVEGLLIESSLQAEMRDALRSVPEDLGRALYYAYVEGLPYKEIARLESIPLGTVMSRLYRARRKLRMVLSGRLPSHCTDDFVEDASVA